MTRVFIWFINSVMQLISCICVSWVEEVCDNVIRSVLYFLVIRLALSSLNKHNEAVGYYKKALELDPENETYKSNLKIAEQKMKETPSPVSSHKCTFTISYWESERTVKFTALSFSLSQTGGMGGVDLAGLLSNPGFMSMVGIFPLTENYTV